jgi:hypothetical protein
MKICQTRSLRVSKAKKSATQDSSTASAPRTSPPLEVYGANGRVLLGGAQLDASAAAIEQQWHVKDRVFGPSSDRSNRSSSAAASSTRPW